MLQTISVRRAGGILVLAGVALVTALLMFPGGPAARAQTGPEMQYFGADGSGFETFVDVGKEGYSPGDDTFFSVTLVDTATDEEAGRAVGICTAIRPSKANTLQRCEFQATLATGKILAIGSFRVGTLDEGAPLSIVGGTGEFDSAAGTLTFTSMTRDGSSGALIDIELSNQP